MQLLIGTSGYSYKEWKGAFYPEKLPAKEMLQYYAERFNTVEINNTYYRLPQPSVVKAWAAETPPGFRFVLKASQSITHYRRLKEAEEPTDRLLELAAALGDRRGPLLVQLHPTMKKDVARLESFLAYIGRRAEVALEARQASWFDDDALAVLRQHNAALCLSDEDDTPAPALIRTGDWGYLRLRRKSYTKKQLSAWLERMREQKWKRAFVFFKHEDTGTGPKLAQRLMELAGVHVEQPPLKTKKPARS